MNSGDIRPPFCDQLKCTRTRWAQNWRMERESRKVDTVRERQQIPSMIIGWFFGVLSPSRHGKFECSGEDHACRWSGTASQNAQPQGNPDAVNEDVGLSRTIGKSDVRLSTTSENGLISVPKNFVHETTSGLVGTKMLQRPRPLVRIPLWPINCRHVFLS